MTHIGKPIRVIENEPAPIKAPIFVPPVRKPEPALEPMPLIEWPTRELVPVRRK